MNKIKNCNGVSGLERRSTFKHHFFEKCKPFYFIVYAFFLTTTAMAQKIELEFNNTPFKTVIKELQQKSDYSFSINGRHLKDARPVTIQTSQKEILEVLPMIFKNQPFDYKVDGKIITSINKQKTSSNNNKEQEPKTIQGRVTDSLGNPLTSVTVRVVGAPITTMTDREGYYTLNLTEPADEIQFNFIGYEPMIRPLEGTDFDVVLYPVSSQLDNAYVNVSTGYQSLPKERATGSFSKVDHETFNRQVSTDVISRLKGIAPSILFDERSGSPKLTIRGQATIFGNDQPLIIVDNFPYEGDINNINPNDIEEVEILKDAAATSIWGVRAGNGVIVIKTKKGKLNQPMSIEVTANTTFGARPDLWYIPKMETTDFIDIEMMLFDKGHYNTIISNTASNRPYSPVVEILNNQRNGLISATDAESKINALRNYDLRDDIHKYLYEPSLKQQYAINLRGGSDKYSYYFSSGFDKNRDTEKGNGFSRISLNTNQVFRPIDKLEITAGLTYNQNNQNTANVVRMLNNMGNEMMYPYARLVDEQGNPAIVTKDHSTLLKEKALSEGLLDWNFNPLEELQMQDNKYRQSGVRVNTAIMYRIVPQLSAEVRFQYENQLGQRRNLYSQDSYTMRDQINRFTTFDEGIMKRNIPLGSRLDNSNNEMNALNGRFQLNYDQQWNKHQVNAIGGFEVRETKFTGASARQYGFDPNVGSSIIVDYLTRFTQYGKGGSGLISNYDNYSETLDRLRSYYFNGAYNYNLRYVLSASARIDQSNLFGVRTNQKSVPLWSAGVKWNIDKESFYNLPWLPKLSLRSTYGYSGNIDRTTTAYTTARLSRNSYNTLPNADLVSPPNKDLRWERNRMFNLGLDFVMKNNRLSGSLEYFNRKGTDLIGNGDIDPTTGFTSFRGNLANMKGEGIDIELNSINVQSINFIWKTTAIFSYVKDKITEYKRSTNITNFVTDNSFGRLTAFYNPVVGRPLFGIYSYPWAGLDPKTGRARGFLNDEPSVQYAQITQQLAEDPENRLIYHGNALPPYFGALRNTFSYKGMDLSFNVTYRFGYYFRRNSIMYSSLYNNYGTHGDYYNRWQKPGDELETNVPAMIYPGVNVADQYYRNSEVLVSKGDHIRLQDINLSYTLNPNLINKLNINTVQVFTSVNNVAMIWKANKVNLDPDFPTTKPVKTISFGLNCNF